MRNQMSNKQTLALAGLALTAIGGACVQTRPSRNGVFNENQYIRKDFLVRDGAGTTDDTGWIMKATITAVSTPNALGSIAIAPGISNESASLVRFSITEDHVDMINMREFSGGDSPVRTPEIVNAWGATNVDLKYRINLDGETTNFLEENQELDWQVRQWVKLKMAKNDMSDVAPLGNDITFFLAACGDLSNASATLVPNEFQIDTANDYMQWKVRITVPLNLTDVNCAAVYGRLGEHAAMLGRQNATFDLLYSFMRATPMDKVTYKPLEIAEKDPIRRKYAPIEQILINRDPGTGLVAAKQLTVRYDPTKPVTYYFSPGFPENYKDLWLAKDTGIKDQTNKILSDAGVAMRVDFKNFDQDLADGQAPREVGDVRYPFLIWASDPDTDEWWGVTVPFFDPRTGENLGTNIEFNEEPYFSIKELFTQQMDAYLTMIGASEGVNKADPKTGAPAEWSNPGPCMDGDRMPLVPDALVANHNSDSLYDKMQTYMQKPSAAYGPLGPQDFIADQDQDFLDAYYAITPYLIFNDPDTNPFVVREGGAGVYGPANLMALAKKEAQFKKITGDIDHGLAPYQDGTGAEGIKNATAFLANLKDLSKGHNDFVYAKQMNHYMHGRFLDGFDNPNSLPNVIARNARQCKNGTWQTKQQWIDDTTKMFWAATFIHEFGHALGLEHNFMGSVDQPNFPHYKDGAGRDHVAMQSNSVMEYDGIGAWIHEKNVWGPYDLGAINFIYANEKPTAIPNDPMTMLPQVPKLLSGQVSPTIPWNDKQGWSSDGKTEVNLLHCTDTMVKYTPMCRRYDVGTRPSEIIANQIDEYEFNYIFRNFRVYRKFWNESGYANGPLAFVTDLRRFMSEWIFDWTSGELFDTFHRIGVKNPNENGSDVEYFTQLTNKFNKEMSAANQMVAAFHKGLIQESSGERPFATVYDKFYGDVTQQGIILDKLFAMQNWVALVPTENYDQNQAGSYIAMYGNIGDASYNYVAEDAVISMIGGQYDVYPYFVPLAVAQFAADTHAPEFGPRVEIRDWIGGWTFDRLQDFQDFFRDIAVKNNACTDIKTCTYDPRPLSDTHNQFFGPDKRLWIWAYVPDRNTWVAVQKERHVASYVIMRNYTDYVVFQQDDGAFPGAAYGALLPMKYFLDAFKLYN